MSLSAQQKKELRGRAHHLHPIVTVGDRGLSDAVVAELERALDDHELVKVKLRADRAERRALAATIVERTGADLVNQIGQVACFYRPAPGTGGANDRG